MKKLFASLIAIVSIAAHAVTATNEWQDIPPSTTLSNIVEDLNLADASAVNSAIATATNGLATTADITTATNGLATTSDVIAATNNIDLSGYLPLTGGTLTGDLVLTGMYDTVTFNWYQVVTDSEGTMNWSEIIPISWYRRELTNIARKASSIVYTNNLTQQVSDIVTNVTAEAYSDWSVSTNWIAIIEASNGWTPVNKSTGTVVGNTIGDADSTYLVWTNGVKTYVGYNFSASRYLIPEHNSLELARLVDLEAASNAIAEQVAMNTDDISSLQTSVSTNTSDIATLKTTSSALYQLFSGSNVVLEVTNYNSTVGNAPKMSLLQLTESNTYTTVWTETNNLFTVANAASNYTATTAANIIDYANTAYAPIAWSSVYSGTGATAPSNQTWITTPTLVLAGGLEFQQTVTSSGNLFFLVDNGMNTVATNKYGFMQLAAADGSPLITIAKTDSYYVGCDPTNITVNGTTVTIEIPVISADHPYVRYVQTLTKGVTPQWLYEEDTIPGITISWSGSSGAWICTIDTSASSGFFAFEVLQEGSTKIEFGGMVDVNTNGILCTDGVHAVRPVYNNGTITWEVIP